MYNRNHTPLAEETMTIKVTYNKLPIPCRDYDFKAEFVDATYGMEPAFDDTREGALVNLVIGLMEDDD